MSYKQLFKQLKKRGWYIARESNHYIWKHPNYSGAIVTSKTPSDRRAIKNILADFNKIKGL